MLTVVKFDVPCNPWMSCKGLPVGPGPTLGNGIILSLGEIHRWGFQLRLSCGCWEPCQLPMCVCRAATRWRAGGRTWWDTLSLGCTGGKSRNTRKKRRSMVHSTGSSVWTVEGPGLLAALQKVPAVLLAPRLGYAGPVLTTAVGSQIKGRMFLYFCLPSQMSALTHPKCGQQDHSLTMSACYVTPVLLGLSCSTVIQ